MGGMPQAITQFSRCTWARNPLAIQYHDEEWGVPVRDDRRWMEFLILEGAQAGLSWDTILQRREHYRRAFAGFDPEVLAEWGEAQQQALLEDAGIIRNRLKIASALNNARAFLAVQKEFGSFNAFLWRQVGGRPRQNQWATAADVPARTAESDALSRELKRRGFNFVGSTICYALMQATGIVNDHLTTCFRHQQLARRMGG